MKPPGAMLLVGFVQKAARRITSAITHSQSSQTDDSSTELQHTLGDGSESTTAGPRRAALRRMAEDSAPERIVVSKRGVQPLKARLRGCRTHVACVLDDAAHAIEEERQPAPQQPNRRYTVGCGATDWHEARHSEGRHSRVYQAVAKASRALMSPAGRNRLACL
jgi:hypothetical protein